MKKIPLKQIKRKASPAQFVIKAIPPANRKRNFNIKESLKN